MSAGSNDLSPLAHTWGLTGGIASGKSTAARLFSEAGIPVIDADQISRELSAPGGAAYDLIVARFGTADRGELRKIVFSDPTARRDLEAILHPLIQQESLRRIQAFGPRPVLYEAALLVETGRFRQFRGLIVVDAPWEDRKKRLMARDRCSEELAENILRAQIGDDERLKAATFVLRNSGSVEDLRARVLELVAKLG